MHPLDPQVVARVQGLAVRAQRVAEGVLAGLHRSLRLGESVDFAEHKAYSPGDDLRHLDWRVLARSDRLIVKRFETETNLRALLVVDLSASMSYRSTGASKAEYAAVLAASLATLLLRQGDAVGLQLLGGRRPLLVPPVAHPEHLRDIVTVLEQARPAGHIRLEQVAATAPLHTGRRGLLVLLSDLLEDDTRWLESLRILTTRGVEVLVLQVLDRDEVEFPFEDPALFESLEDERRLLVAPRQLRNEYRRLVATWLERLRGGLALPGARYELALTDEPAHRPLIRLLHPARAARSRTRP